MITPSRSGIAQHRSRPAPATWAYTRAVLAVGVVVPLLLGDGLTALHALAPLRLLAVGP